VAGAVDHDMAALPELGQVSAQLSWRR
jgi:hypothetical protein